MVSATPIEGRLVTGFPSLRGRTMDQLLGGLCTSDVFERGVRYYQDGRVKSIDSSGNAIRATVQGTRRYTVILGPPRNSRELASYSCTCPYDYGGCCKHVVATIIAASQSMNEAERSEGAYRSGGDMYKPSSPREYDGDDEFDDDEEEITAGGPLDVVSEEVFTDHSGARRGRRRIQSSADAMLRSLDQFEAAVCTFSEPTDDAGIGAPTIDPALSEFMTEGTVRQWVNPQNYLSGVQYYMEGRVSERRVWRSTLSGKVNVHRKGRLQLFRNGKTEYSVWIRVGKSAVRRDGASSNIDAYCGCFEGGENEPCGHIASLLIAWSRKPTMFENAKISDPAGRDETNGTERRFAKKNGEMEKATHRVLVCLQEVLELLEEEQTCSRNESLALLEKVYSKIRLTSANLHERTVEASRLKEDEKRHQLEALLGFSLLVNTVSARLLACFERKFEVGLLTNLLTDVSLEMIGKQLDGFANKGGTAPARGTSGDMTRRLEADAGEEVGREGILTHESPDQEEEPAIALANGPAGGGEGTSGRVSRSWDGLVEEFAGG